MAEVTASTVRAAALRSRCLSVEKTCSIGLRSGEYLGRKKSLALAERMAANGLAVVAAEIVHGHEVAGSDRREQHLLDIGLIAVAVDRPVEGPRRVNAVVAQSGDEGHGVPAAVGNFSDEPFAKRGPIRAAP